MTVTPRAMLARSATVLAAAAMSGAVLTTPVHSAPVSSSSVVDATGSWSAIGGSPNGTVFALTTDAQGSLFVGGDFTSIGGQPLNRIARWGPPSLGGDDTYTSLGEGLDDTVRALAWDDTLYIGGEFTREVGGVGLSGVAAWARRGTDDTYVPLDLGVTGSGRGVLTILPTDDTIYVGGEFDSASSVNDTRRMAGWVDDTWVSIGGGIPDCALAERVLAFAEVPAQGLVVGGKFRCAGSDTSEDDTNISVWDGTQWNPMEGGVRPTLANAGEIVAALVTDGQTLYVGGDFTSAGPVANPVTMGSLATWDGSSWSSIGGGLSGACGTASGDPEVYSLQLDAARGLLYAAGAFCRAGDDTVNSIVVRDLGVDEWVPLIAPSAKVGLTTTNLSEGVFSLALDDSVLYAGGMFTAAGGVGGPDMLARWAWDPPSGTNAVTASPGQAVSLSGRQFIGVPATGGVYIGGVPSPSYVRDDTASFSGVVVPAGISGTVAIEVEAVGGRAVIGTLTVPPPPATPASAPVGVSADGGDGAALVSWSSPTFSGSFPVTNYQVSGSPSGGCVVSGLSCEISGLTNGVEYSFRVRALTGAGWGAWSSLVTVVPEPPAPEPSIMITGSRDGGEVRVAGVTTGLVGAQVTPWVRFPGPGGYAPGEGVRTVQPDGTFTWQRETRKKIYVYFRAQVDGVDTGIRSNRVIIQAR